ncbi:SDR family NAD(P)-dependent oxidoreductase [Nocardioides sp. NPDC127503]|uniref:SDR family NAD(P)-dependent oxidoreductase n=1 Tax=Nocardioides sp. NPDC127503 TaxID=3154516 RepID=UPI0027CD890C|nr:SDR family NAD(P)-dependent oxidoreductase [Actinomycetota bacterium]
MKSFDDKVVVLTGAGSGIGRALAVNLAGRRARLALSDVNEAGLAETVELAKQAGAREIKADKLDVADREAFTTYAEGVIAHFGQVNVVINNAGVALSGRVNDLDWEDIDWIMGIDWWGVVHGTKLFLPALIESGDAHIVNISSLFGLVSMPDQAFYNAAKYAVRGFTEALREEMLIDGHNVGVTSVHPGGIKTAVARSARVSAKDDQAATAKFFDEKLAKMEPARAAEIIVKGIEKKQARVLVGLDAHVIHNFGKFTGSRYQDLIAMGAKYVMPKKNG